MEFRINAEDPSLGFVPFPGIVESLQVPTGSGIRFDSGWPPATPFQAATTP